MDAFLMVGQSNMAGRGALDEVSPIRDERIFMLRNGRWQTMAEPVNYDRPFAGVGPAASFAEAYVQAYGREVGLIPCADGGTKLSEWQPGEPPYEHAVLQAKLALRTSRLCGVLWHQGESDSDYLADAEAYEEHFRRMFEGFKKDLLLGGVPWLMGELGGFLANYQHGCGYFEQVNAAIRQIAETTPGIALVRADGLTANSDNLHFSSISQRAFGRRYFEMYQQAVNP